jgi:hypothetical protein
MGGGLVTLGVVVFGANRVTVVRDHSLHLLGRILVGRLYPRKGVHGDRRELHRGVAVHPSSLGERWVSPVEACPTRRTRFVLEITRRTVIAIARWIAHAGARGNPLAWLVLLRSSQTASGGTSGFARRPCLDGAKFRKRFRSLGRPKIYAERTRDPDATGVCHGRRRTAVRPEAGCGPRQRDRWSVDTADVIVVVRGSEYALSPPHDRRCR